MLRNSSPTHALYPSQAANMSEFHIDNNTGQKVVVERMLTNLSPSPPPSCKGGSPDPASSTYLGSNLWDQTIPFDPSCRDSLDYLELENFLDENREFIDIKNLVDCLDDSKNESPLQTSDSQELSTPQHNPDFFIPNLEEPPKQKDPPPTPSSNSAVTVLPNLLFDTFPISPAPSPGGSSCMETELRSSPAGEVFTPLPSEDSAKVEVKKKKKSIKVESCENLPKLAQLCLTERGKEASEGRKRKRKTKDLEEDEDYVPSELSKRKKKKKSKKNNSNSPTVKALDSKLPFLPKVELKTTPIVKKGSKKYVPTEAKDEKYWARREKNNVAAKRSRDARRMKENQIVLRATILEEEHAKMAEELKKAKKLIESLKKRLSKYEKV